MTQLVFVHGVTVRNDPANRKYEDDVLQRHKAFQEMGFGGDPVDFYDPYWGMHGANKPFKSIEFDDDDAFLLGGATDVPGPADALEGSDLAGTSLMEAAHLDFEATVDALCVVLANPDHPSHNPELALRLADYLNTLDDTVDDVEGSIAKPDWFTGTQLGNDAEFLVQLQRAAYGDSVLELGLEDSLNNAGRWLIGKGIGLIDGPFAWLARKRTPALAVFLGDAMVYLKRGAHADERFGKIRKVIGDDLVKAAQKARSANDKLIVVGHSMGANILYDMLIDQDLVERLETEIGGPLQIDLFLTVGTQVGLLQELELFRAGPASRPAPCLRWWHVYNYMDVLSFGARKVFTGVEEFRCDTNANIFSAHGAYFTSPVFQRKLHKRLKAHGLAS